MKNIDMVLSSYFGPRWPFVFICFGILLVICMVQLYFMSSKTIFEINGDVSNKLWIFLIWFGLLFTLIVICLFLYAYKKYREHQIELKQEEGDFADYSKLKQFFQLIGIIASLIISIIILVVILKKLRKK